MADKLLTSGELLKKVKVGLGINGDYHNDTLNLYIDEVKSFLISAGVKKNVVQTSAAVGVICRGVADLWNYGAGNAQLSDYFKQRVTQLSLCEPNDTTAKSSVLLTDHVTGDTHELYVSDGKLKMEVNN